MQTFFTVLLAILAFGVLIIAHEFGHFITAKRGGIQVNEFWIGMGPVLFKKNWHGTDYCLRLLPLGGACVMEGEDEASENPRSFGKAKIGRKMLVVVAGALMNFIVGLLIVIGLYAFSSQVQVFTTTKIGSFLDGFSSQGETMLMPGDQIIKIDGYRTLLYSDVVTGLSRGAEDGKYDFVIRRNGEKLLLKDVPLTRDFVNDEGKPIFGINFAQEEKTPVTLVKNAVYISIDFGRMVWDSLGMLITGQVGVDQLSGPVGVAGAMAETAKSSFADFLLLVAFISINLGVMNLLPLPALDGGRLVFLIIEAFRGKPVPPKYEGWVHAAGLALLMVLMIYVTGQDIIRLITG